MKRKKLEDVVAASMTPAEPAWGALGEGLTLEDPVVASLEPRGDDRNGTPDPADDRYPW